MYIKLLSHLVAYLRYHLVLPLENTYFYFYLLKTHHRPFLIITIFNILKHIP